jgi:hypothetical protein
MRDTIDMAREAGCIPVRHPEYDNDVQVFATPDVLKAFEALVRADERWEQSKRRGVLAFCPYTGKPRHPSDIASDPHGILILVPDQPLRARGNT